MRCTKGMECTSCFPKGEKTSRCWTGDLWNWVAVIRCGLHSGIPKCCIRWYVRVYKPFFISHCVDKQHGSCHVKKQFLDWNSFRKEQNKLLHEQIELNKKGFGINYFPCPDCLENWNFVELKPCPVSYKREGV